MDGNGLPCFIPARKFVVRGPFFPICFADAPVIPECGYQLNGDQPAGKVLSVQFIGDDLPTLPGIHVEFAVLIFR